MKETRLKDLYLCAFLLNEGQVLVRMEKEGQRCWFVFEQSVSLDELMNNFWQDLATTKARSYVNKIQNLKDMIFSEK
mgnify:CR=1 FL=1